MLKAEAEAAAASVRVLPTAGIFWDASCAVGNPN